MTHANLVADELHNAGFRTKSHNSNFISVSLTSRKVSISEVETALDQLFEAISFELHSINTGVLVEV